MLFFLLVNYTFGLFAIWFGLVSHNKKLKELKKQNNTNVSDM